MTDTIPPWRQKSCEVFQTSKSKRWGIQLHRYSSLKQRRLVGLNAVLAPSSQKCLLASWYRTAFPAVVSKLIKGVHSTTSLEACFHCAACLCRCHCRRQFQITIQWMVSKSLSFRYRHVFFHRCYSVVMTDQYIGFYHGKRSLAMFEHSFIR